LSRYLPRYENRNRFMRGSVRGQEGDGMAMDHNVTSIPVHMELPPGGTFDPDPQKEINDLSQAIPQSLPRSPT
jgi:putative (di)nucleoside polyphosphate hydrolase